MLDADTDGNPGFATRHVLDIGVRVTVNVLQWSNSACTTVVYSVDIVDEWLHIGHIISSCCTIRLMF